MRLKFPARLKKPGYRYIAALVLTAVIVTSPKWSHAIVHRLTFFHVRKLELRGVRYLEPQDVVARIRIDTSMSITDDLAPLVARLKSHPQVAGVEISRRLPGTLVITFRENLPVALVPVGDGMQPYDSAGKALPIDPSRIELDLPVVTAPDRGALALVGAMRVSEPRLFARLSDVTVLGRDLVFNLTPALRVRAAAGVAPQRFEDIFPVESDLARRNEHASELDIRYRDQVIARLQ